MQKFINHCQKTIIIFHLVLIFILASCSSYRQVSDYPYYYSYNQHKSNFLPNALNLHSHHKNVKTSLSEHPSSLSSGRKTNIINQAETIQLNDLIKQFPSQSIAPLQANNQDHLTASLSVVPIIPVRYSYMATNKRSVIPIPDTNLTKNSQALPLATAVNENDIVKKQKKAETFSVISFIAALLGVLLLLASNPIFIIFSIAAIIFGAKGLKSPKKKLARIGMIIGIVSLAISLLAVIILVISGGYGM